MTRKNLVKNIIEEIEQIPEEKLFYIYKTIHNIKIDKQKELKLKSKILNFAGAWNDMEWKNYENFISEIYERRETSFSNRSNR